MTQLVEVELVVGAGGDEVVVSVPHVGVHVAHPGPQQVLGLPSFLIVRTDRETEPEMFGNRGWCS